MASVEVTSLEKLLGWKLSELKKSCKSYCLPVSGTKAELAERLHMYHVTAAEQAANSELNEAELLGELDESSTLTEVTQDDAPVDDDNDVSEITAVPEAVKPVEAAKPAKAKAVKAGLKRKLNPAKPAPVEEALPEEKDVVAVASPVASSVQPSVRETKTASPDVAVGAPKAPKMTEEERKLARAKRFGLNTSSPSGELSQLEKRAARFGEIIAPVLQKSAEQDKLQRRRERFGIVNSSSGPSEEERKKKRLERFQDSSAPPPKASSEDDEEKKRRRLERFGAVTAPSASTGSEAEKLAKRAERFGVQSEEAKKMARAKRFGVTA